MAEYLDKDLYASDSAVIVEFGDGIDMKTNAKCSSFVDTSNVPNGGIGDGSTYRSLAVILTLWK